MGRGTASTLRIANLALCAIAVLAPMAHVLELPNKLALDGPLWLATQQHLYRGWGPFLGGPAEIGALATSVALALLRRRDRHLLRPTILACIAYAAMIAIFLVFNAPVNAAVDTWTSNTLPPDWSSYRLRWEAGHAIACALSLIGLAALLRAYVLEKLHAS
ncbi:MAG TPA: hypothetical protein VFF88_04250 [Methylocella sp.]|jgi:hypothetical protein|nr:hypothetical protein [Methylocella sp.]